jgi:ribonuclease D
MTIHLHKGDLPAGLGFGTAVAVDTETMGLNPRRDRLCLVQLSAGDGNCHLVQITGGPESAPRLKALLADPAVTKLFHFARFDLAVLKNQLGVTCAPVYCTKLASKLARTNIERHGLKDLCRDLLGVEISKQQQTSDWGAATLSPEQLEYAASDVRHLHALRDRLDTLLAREGRRALAAACFGFLPTLAILDVTEFDGIGLFSH